jgi:histidine triad (HIT) family protein
VTDDCIFCKIVTGEVPAAKVYEDDHVVAFHDISPAAPIHVLVIPRKHIASADHLTAGDSDLLGHIFTAAQHVARDQGIAETGYRVVTNAGKHAGQVVHHLHFHVIGGKMLGHFG